VRAKPSTFLQNNDIKVNIRQKKYILGFAFFLLLSCSEKGPFDYPSQRDLEEMAAMSSSGGGGSSSSTWEQSSSSVEVSSSSEEEGSSSSIGEQSSSSEEASSSSSEGGSSSSAEEQSSSSVEASSSSSEGGSSSSLSSCGNYNEENEFCRNSRVYEKCGDGNGNGKHEYDPETQFCYNNRTLDKCGGQEYDPVSEQCRLGFVEKRCGGSWYVPQTQFCSNSGVYDKCGGISEYIPGTEQCCGTGKYTLATEQCCGNSGYDPITKGCCNNAAIFDKSVQRCENNILETKCGSGWYNAAVKSCCYGEIVCKEVLEVQGSVSLTADYGSNTFFKNSTKLSTAGGVSINNAASAECGNVVYKVESGSFAVPGDVSICAYATCSGVEMKLREAACASGTVVNDPSLVGECYWSPNSVIHTYIDNPVKPTPVGVTLIDSYGRCAGGDRALAPVDYSYNGTPWPVASLPNSGGYYNGVETNLACIANQKSCPEFTVKSNFEPFCEGYSQINTLCPGVAWDDIQWNVRPTVGGTSDSPARCYYVQDFNPSSWNTYGTYDIEVNNGTHNFRINGTLFTTWSNDIRTAANNKKDGGIYIYAPAGKITGVSNAEDMIPGTSLPFCTHGVHRLYCQMPTNGVDGIAIQPSVTCLSGDVPNITNWSSAPNWNNPVEGTYNVSVNATCGSSGILTASCGRLRVLAADTPVCDALAYWDNICPETAWPSGVLWNTVPEGGNAGCYYVEGFRNLSTGTFRVNGMTFSGYFSPENSTPIGKLDNGYYIYIDSNQNWGNVYEGILGTRPPCSY